MAQEQVARSVLQTLQGAKYISLTTYRRTGEGVATPVWFAQEADRLYIETGPKTGKVKRMRRTPRVTLAPCTFGGAVTGPALAGSRAYRRGFSRAGAGRTSHGTQIWACAPPQLWLGRRDAGVAAPAQGTPRVHRHCAGRVALACLSSRRPYPPCVRTACSSCKRARATALPGSTFARLR